MTKKDSKVKVDKHNIYVSNAQYLLIHGDELPYIDMIFCDECHQCKAGSEITKLIKSVKINYKFGCTGTLPKAKEDCWKIAGVFGPVLDEIEIQKLQEQKVLADVKLYPIRFMHRNKENFKKVEYDENGVKKDPFEVAQAAYQKESMYLGMHCDANRIVLELCKKVVTQHPEWNGLILFDYTSQGEQLYDLLNYDKKHYVDGAIDVDIRKKVIETMDTSGGNITIAQSKCFSTGLTIQRINFIVLVTTSSSCTKIIQSIGRGLRRQNKTAVLVIDVSHNYEYSMKHFKERAELYKKFYGLIQGKDYEIKGIEI